MNEINNAMSDEEFAAKARMMYGGRDNSWTLNRINLERAMVEGTFGVYQVYVQINFANYVIAIESSAFLDDTTGWVKVDEGSGELYKFARVKYGPKGLMTEGGYNYKLVDGVVVYAPQIEQPEDHNEMASKEELFAASRKYEAGELISIQNRMFEATTVVLAGTRIIPGSNVQETTLEQYINKKVEEALAK